MFSNNLCATVVVVVVGRMTGKWGQGTTEKSSLFRIGEVAGVAQPGKKKAEVGPTTSFQVWGSQNR